MPRLGFSRVMDHHRMPALKYFAHRIRGAEIVSAIHFLDVSPKHIIDDALVGITYQTSLLKRMRFLKKTLNHTIATNFCEIQHEHSCIDVYV